MVHLQSNSYGKQRVRLTKVLRGKAPDGSPLHEVQEYTVQIMLHGDFEAIYTHGDNANCGPTDTMKNTVYAIARQTSFDSPEHFGLALTSRFIDHFPQVHAADVQIEMSRWRRIEVEGQAHPFAFMKQHGQRTAAVTRRRTEGPSDLSVAGGVSGLEVFKSSGSAFGGFFRDEFTTLPDTDERILATTVDAVWNYLHTPGLAAGEIAFNEAWDTSYQAITEVFATHNSPSLQATLFVMGEEMLKRTPTISDVSFTMPNQHHILFDLTPFELDNPDQIYYGTDSPFGIITGTVARGAQPGTTTSTASASTVARQ